MWGVMAGQDEQQGTRSERRVDVSETSAEVQPPDPFQEPPNSTVGDWFGQEADRDADAAEKALAEAGGDAGRAEQIFAEERPEHESEKWSVPPAERP
jgi:hypothetical protein